MIAVGKIRVMKYKLRVNESLHFFMSGFHNLLICDVEEQRE